MQTSLIIMPEVSQTGDDSIFASRSVETELHNARNQLSTSCNLAKYGRL